MHIQADRHGHDCQHCEERPVRVLASCTTPPAPLTQAARSLLTCPPLPFVCLLHQGAPATRRSTPPTCSRRAKAPTIEPKDKSIVRSSKYGRALLPSQLAKKERHRIASGRAQPSDSACVLHATERAPEVRGDRKILTHHCTRTVSLRIGERVRTGCGCRIGRTYSVWQTCRVAATVNSKHETGGSRCQ